MKHFEKLVLDFGLLDDLIKLGVSENLIVKNYDGESIEKDFVLQGKKPQNRSKLLFNLCLYETFDCGPQTGSYYSMDKFLEHGLLKKNYKFFNDDTPSKSIWSLRNDEKYLFDFTIHILRKEQTKIVSHLRTSPHFAISGIDERRYNIYYKFAIEFISSGAQEEVEDMFRNMGELDVLLSIYSSDYPIAEFFLFFSYFEVFFQALLLAFKQSDEDGCHFTSKFFSSGLGSSAIESYKLREDFFYTVQISLKEETCIIPTPKSFDDLFYMREKKELVRFRNKLSDWFDIIQEGNAKLEKAVRRDLYLANKELKRLGNYREYKEGPVAFWLNSIGGHIPIFSNILTIVNMGAGFYEQWAKRKADWVLFLD